MIKAFLFDYDGVITHGVDVTLPAKRLAENVDISIDRSSELIKSIWTDYSIGTISTDEVWKYFEEQLGIKIPIEKRNIWHTWEELTPIPLMIELVKELRNADYKVGLVSNVFQDTADMIRKNGGYKEFDFLILSCELGARKPDAAIYDAALAELGDIKPEEVLYLDDREPLIDAARAYGLECIHVTDHLEALKQVKEIIG